MHVARLYGAAIEFDEETRTALELPDAYPDDLEKALRERSPSYAPVDLLQLNGNG